MPDENKNNKGRGVTRRIHLSRLSNASSDLQLHAPAGRLRVAVYSEFFPVAYRDKSRARAYAGLDVDIIEGFCLAHGLRPQYVKVADWNETWAAPQKWDMRVDVAIGGIGRSDWRNAPGVEWTVPYFSVRRTVVYNRADPIRRFPEDVTGVVAGTMGTTGTQDAIERLRRKFGSRDAWDHLEARWKSPDAKDIDDLLRGKIQGLMRGSFVGKAIVAKHPDKLGMAEPWDASPHGLKPYGQEVFAFPCRRGSGLAVLLSAHLMRISSSGELYALAQKHGMGLDEEKKKNKVVSRPNPKP